jgi:hypothetical protein
MVAKILAGCVLAVICGILYRLGGSSKGNRLYRILGCPICVIIALLGLFWGKEVPFWAYLCVFGANAGAVSAYWGLDEKRFGYWAHGLGLSLAILPIILFTGTWWLFAIRSVALVAGITLWSEYTKWDVLEEWGRGALIILTLLLFLIH